MILRHRGLNLRLLRLARRLGAASLAVGLTAVVATCTLFRSSPPARLLPQVRVLLASGRPTVEVAIDGSYQALDARGGILATGSRLAPGRLQTGADGLELNGVPLRAASVRLLPRSGEVTRFQGRSYAGALVVQRTEEGLLEVENHLDIERYVAGVLFSEMPASFPEEALRAQAVAARSFARWRLRDGGRLRATESDQVYAGEGDLAARARQIVQSTEGQVLEYQGEPLPAYFSSTCGGATGSAARVFGGEALPPLDGRECTWCSSSPLYRWNRELSVRVLARALGLPDGRPWTRLVPQRADPFGRPDLIRLEGDGWRESMPAPALRSRWNAVAPAEQKLPGAWLLEARVSGDRLRWEGAGFGHGVGMCQYGAQGLARAGQDHRRILAYYYGGADLVRRW